jgi:hypothetical protein
MEIITPIFIANEK